MVLQQFLTKPFMYVNGGASIFMGVDEGTSFST